MSEFGKYAADLIRAQMEANDEHAAYKTSYFCYQMGKLCFNDRFANNAALICRIIQKIIQKKGVAHDT